MVRLVTRSAKARFDQVGNQVSKVKDQVGQGQGQELDNIGTKCIIKKNKIPLKNLKNSTNLVNIVKLLALALAHLVLSLVNLVTNLAEPSLGQPSY